MSPSLQAQPDPDEQRSEVISGPGGAHFHRWYGHAGRTYFIQVSDSNNPLAKWNWLPAIEAGNDEEISHVVGGTAPSVFFRLRFIDQVPGSGETLDTADYDQDGLSNLSEILPPPPLLPNDATDPLNPDTDHDSLTDGFERSHGLDPNDDGTTNPDNGPNGDPDNDGLSNAEELAFGTAPTNPDTDGDGVSDSDEILVNFTNPLTATDGDGDGIPDDFEKHLANLLLAYQPAATHWGDYHPGLLAGNLDATHDYTGEGMTARELADILGGLPQAGVDESGLHVEPQIRGNKLEWAVSSPPAGNSPGWAEGVYWYSEPLGIGQRIGLSSLADFTPAYLTARIGSVQWGSPLVGNSVAYNSFSTQWAEASAGFLISPEGPVATRYRGFIREARFRIIASRADHPPFSDHYLKITSKYRYLDRIGNGEILSAEAITIQLPKGKFLSGWYEFQAPMINGQETVVSLLPVEVAPEVLAVNSDFDEGRIDPGTGYAIPDCDDTPGVDRKTGSGNTQIALNASRAHLDGLFANDEKVTDDMHKGWFGVNPNQLDDDFWDGANVTIRKIDRIDDETGYKESGQVRFYAKWNGGYYGISPYDFQTLQPVNLVSAGVNLRPGEGVYGASSTIPDGAEFYMEGVCPGKITLEWRLQKGSIDVKHEQTFLVETRKSPQEWRSDLAYKIRLDTDNDPSGQIDVIVDPRGAPRDYWTRVERMSEYYDYYQENYMADDNYQWCGMARLAGSQVISGTSDARFATLTPSAIVFRIVGELIDALSEGGYDIFDSLAWQHHAYRSSGLGALEWTNDNSNDNDLDALIDSWREFDDGVHTGNANSIAAATLEMTRHEQQEIIVPTWSELRAITPVNNEVTNTFTILAENVMKPSGDRFTVAVPGGDLSNTADRWMWIDDSVFGSLNGIVGAWKAAGKAGQRSLVSKTLRVDSERFSQVPAALRATAGLFPEERSGMQVRDDLDTP